jgi:UDP-glucose 4-epimerase
MKILVTGAAGFIGRALCEKLSAEGHYVVATDLAEPEIPGCRGVWGDLLRAPARLLRVLSVVGLAREPYDVVCHLAGRMGPSAPPAGWPGIWDTNLTGTINALHVARNLGARRFVLASSVAVHGEMREPSDQTPLSAYGASKLAAEQASRIEATVDPPMGVSLVRLNTVYGPGARAGNVIRWLCEELLDGRCPLEVRDICRDLLYIVDAVAMLVAELTREEPLRVVEAGHGLTLRLVDVAGTLADLVGSPEAEIEPMPRGPYAPYMSYAPSPRGLAVPPVIDAHTGLRLTLSALQEAKSKEGEGPDGDQAAQGGGREKMPAGGAHGPPSGD